LKVINLFAGPGARKSTKAAGIFHHLKSQNLNCEAVWEYPKDIVWERSWDLLDDQIHIFGEQQRKLYRLRGKVEYVVNDSPLLLSIVYGAKAHKKYLDGWQYNFIKFVLDIHNQYNNINFFVNRDDHFKTEGRQQTRAEAVVKDDEIKHMLIRLGIDFTMVSNITEILDILREQDVRI
jgi:hypothetical protein